MIRWSRSRTPVIVSAVFGAMVLLAPRSPVAAQRLFVGGDLFPLEFGAGSLRVDDFNRDGRGDVAVVHGSRGTVGVLLGGTAPLFGEETTYDTGLGVVYLTSGDLTRDGFPDLLAVNTGASTVSVLLNEGDGTFSRRGDYPVGRDPRFAALADFNADGTLDVVTTNLLSGDLQILLGDGAGSFAPSARVPVGDNPHHLTVNDFDGDGAADVAVAHSGALTWFRGLPGGSFERAVDLPMVPDPEVLTSGDFNSDGKNDLAAVDDEGHLLFLKNPGDGMFDVQVAGVVPGFSFDQDVIGYLFPVDFDGDGFLDLTTQFSRLGEFGIRVYHGAGDGTFPRETGVFLDGSTADVGFDDLDGDGLLDAVVTRTGAAELVVFRGMAPGELSARTVIPLDDGPRDLVSLDADGNGTTDLMALSTGALTLLKVDPSGTFESPIVQEFPGTAFQNMSAADFNGDGRIELALTDLADSRLVIAFLDDAGSVTRTLGHRLVSLPTQLTAADFDGDGISDLAIADQTAPVVTVLLKPGVAGQTETIVLPLGSGQTVVAAGDLDGDGPPDLAVATRANLRVFLGDGAGRFPRSLDVDGFALSRALRIADVDLDGTNDLVVAASGGRLAVLSSVREGEAPDLTEIDFGGEIRAVEVFDLDLDGSPDLVTASQKAVTVVRGSRDGVFAAPERYAVGSSPRAVVAADFDADGRPDLATADFASRVVSILRGAKSGVPNAAFRRADANIDGVVGIADAVTILERLFGGAAALPCPDSADVDDDGVLALTDAVRVLAYLFDGGAPPPAPGPEICGVDPSADQLAPCRGGCG